MYREPVMMSKTTGAIKGYAVGEGSFPTLKTERLNL